MCYYAAINSATSIVHSLGVNAMRFFGLSSSFSCGFFREFARWKVRNTAIERRDLIRNPVPLMPEFQRSVRLLGRRPTTQQFIDTIIKKYGTHILISATLGGRRGWLVSFCSLSCPINSFFTRFFKSVLNLAAGFALCRWNYFICKTWVLLL